MKSLKILDQSLIRTKKVVIVGNAGITAKDSDAIQQERNNIDLIRFNNYATRKDIEYTANKNDCDILFSTLDLHSAGAKPRDVVLGIPFPFQARRNLKNLDNWYKDSDVWMVDPFKNMEMNDELMTGTDGYAHPFPSIGFTALWHLKDWDCEIYVCGFNWYNNGTKFQGWNLKNKNYPKHWNHNYPREILWIYKNLFPKINIKFSKECEFLLKLAGRLSK